MKKIALKFFMVVIFAILMTFTANINPNVKGFKLAIGADKAMASDIPCYSESKRNWNYAYVDCASCRRLTGWRATEGVGTCSTEPPKE